MFTSITWGEYLFFILLILFIYYSSIAVIYYKWELLALVGIRRIESAGKISTSTVKDQLLLKAGDDDAAVLTSLEHELHALFTNCSDKISETELLQSTSKILQKYPSDKVKVHRKDLQHFINTETNLYFPGLINKQEVEQLWFG